MLAKVRFFTLELFHVTVSCQKSNQILQKERARERKSEYVGGWVTEKERDIKIEKERER